MAIQLVLRANLAAAATVLDSLSQVRPVNAVLQLDEGLWCAEMHTCKLMKGHCLQLQCLGNEKLETTMPPFAEVVDLGHFIV